MPARPGDGGETRADRPGGREARARRGDRPCPPELGQARGLPPNWSWWVEEAAPARSRSKAPRPLVRTGARGAGSGGLEGRGDGTETGGPGEGRTGRGGRTQSTGEGDRARGGNLEGWRGGTREAEFGGKGDPRR